MSLWDTGHAAGQDGPCEPRLQNHGPLDSWFTLHHTTDSHQPRSVVHC